MGPIMVQDGDVVSFDRLPPERERRVWQEWLRRHGVDPKDVAVPGRIERREAEYQLRYVAYALTPDGAKMLSRDRTDVERVTRVFQMEGRPLPFPSMT